MTASGRKCAKDQDRHLRAKAAFRRSVVIVWNDASRRRSALLRTDADYGLGEKHVNASYRSDNPTEAAVNIAGGVPRALRPDSL
jgi:hypothetical protein